MKDIESIKKTITGALLKTKRPGVEQLLGHMEEIGFYASPCSTQYHLARAGGLAGHSLIVFELMAALALELSADVPEDSITICALLHDIGKCGQFGKPGYVPNMLKGRTTKTNPNPEPVQSAAKPYISNPALMCMDHEVRALQIIGRYVELTEEESWAILMHNGLYGSFKYQIPGKETPLYLLLHMADMWASRVLEKEEGKDE